MPRTANGHETLEEAGQNSPRNLLREYGLATLSFQMSSFQNCQRIYFCYFKPLSQWYFITPALGNQINVSLLPSRSLPSSHAGHLFLPLHVKLTIPFLWKNVFSFDVHQLIPCRPGRSLNVTFSRKTSWTTKSNVVTTCYLFHILAPSFESLLRK